MWIIHHTKQSKSMILSGPCGVASNKEDGVLVEGVVDDSTFNAITGRTHCSNSLENKSWVSFLFHIQNRITGVCWS